MPAMPTDRGSKSVPRVGHVEFDDALDSIVAELHPPFLIEKAMGTSPPRTV